MGDYMKILIVEDDSTIRSGLKYCLEYEQFEVREAALNASHTYQEMILKEKDKYIVIILLS